MQPEALALLSHSDDWSDENDDNVAILKRPLSTSSEEQRHCRCDSGSKKLLAALAVALVIGAIAGGVALIANLLGLGQSPNADAILDHLIAEPVRCAADEFRCHSGYQCLAKHEVCDGIEQCFDLSDEKKCPTCPGYRFNCGGDTGQCIRREWRCDREFDCDNRADEEGCDVCNKTAGLYTCDNYRCIPEDAVCDGIDDCGDSSDETFCVTTSGAGLLEASTRGAMLDSRRPQPLPVCYQQSLDWPAVASDLCALVGSSHLYANVSGVAVPNATGTVYAHLAEVAPGANDSAQTMWPSARAMFECPSSKVVALHCQECGKVDSSYRQTRVIGGRPASPARKWPWFVRLLVGGVELCGGTLISDRHVLTAAHCFDKSRHSELVLDSDDLLGSGGWRTVGKRVHIHPRYQASESMKRYDYAVVEIPPTPTKLALLPACLPRAWERDAFTKPANCYVVGFGRIFGTSGKAYPRKLQEAKVKVFSRAECQFFYKDNHVDMKDDMICAGSDTGGVDTCEGDSGGPLICLRRGSWWLVGITSWGMRCGTAMPSIYASVADAFPWLLSILNQQL